MIGIDNLNDYYDVSLKEARISELELFKNFNFMKVDISDRQKIEDLFNHSNFDRVVHLAAQVS